MTLQFINLKTRYVAASVVTDRQTNKQKYRQEDYRNPAAHVSRVLIMNIR